MSFNFRGERPIFGRVHLQNLADTVNTPPNTIQYGNSDTRAKVLAEVGKDVPIGSIYVSSVTGATTATKFYIKRANAGASTDWERIVTAAQD
jgi:hypothetical protein